MLVEANLYAIEHRPIPEMPGGKQHCGDDGPCERDAYANDRCECGCLRCGPWNNYLDAVDERENDRVVLVAEIRRLQGAVTAQAERLTSVREILINRGRDVPVFGEHPYFSPMVKLRQATTSLQRVDEALEAQQPINAAASLRAALQHLGEVFEALVRRS